MKKIAVAVLFVVAVVALAWPWLRNEIAIDACLDAGGRWDYENKNCDGATKE